MYFLVRCGIGKTDFAGYDAAFAFTTRRAMRAPDLNSFRLYGLSLGFYRAFDKRHPGALGNMPDIMYRQMSALFHAERARDAISSVRSARHG